MSDEEKLELIDDLIEGILPVENVDDIEDYIGINNINDTFYGGKSYGRSQLAEEIRNILNHE